MWSRSELKSSAKGVLKRNYWKSVLAGVILAWLLGSGAFNAGKKVTEESDDITNALNGVDPAALAAGIGVVVGALLIVMIINLLLRIFIWNPLEVGCERFFVQAHETEAADLQNILYSFKNGYGHIGGIMFMRSLFIGLWSCLLIIPGIVKSYEYMMIPYLLAENPAMSRQEAFAKSKEMMKGNKMNAFVLDLSFIGWMLLGAVTFGILDVFYVHPYLYLTKAELYRTLRDAQ